ncbi:MAG: sigma-54-dependent Fis family transcriptional regulator [Planctomycetes bacterium]|nr:sigma-54-dependent Fis family transcriptional regulator [Planctomycetota bacterium]
MSTSHQSALITLLAAAEVKLASAKAGDPELEATLALGRLSAALGEARAIGLLLSAVDSAEALGREEIGRTAVIELGRCLVRGRDVALGRGNLDRGLGEAQRSDDALVPEHVALAALGLVEAWLADGDLQRAQASLALAPRRSPHLHLCTALLALANDDRASAAKSLQVGLAACAGLSDPISVAALGSEFERALGSLHEPSVGERIDALSVGDLRTTLRSIITICDAPNEDPWSAAADVLRRLQGAAGVELEVSGIKTQSPSGTEFVSDREFEEGAVSVRLSGGEANEERDFLSRLVLKVCQRMTAPSQRASERVLQMLDRLLESDLEGSHFFDLATQLAVEATGAARGRLVRLSSGLASPWEVGEADTFVSRSLLRHVVLTGRPLLLEDASDAPPVAVGESVGAKGLRSVVAAPLFGRRGRVLGVLYLDDPGTIGRFGAAEATVVAGFAARLGPQLENDLRAELRSKAQPGGSPALPVPVQFLESARDSDVPLLISGESGVGKEHLARRIHAESKRAERPFVVAVCGAIAAELLESELFGHEAGAFTGAQGRREGLFQRADGGVLFFAGLQDASPRLQAELLRAVETGEIRPLGGTPKTVNVRVVATYMGDPQQGVSEGRLRQDLYYRLSVLQLRLPPLREREHELETLVHALLTRLGEPERELTAKAMARLRAYTWPGNLRELQAVLERALVEAGSETLQARHFRFRARIRPPGETPLRLNSRQLHVVSTLLAGQVLRNTDHAKSWGVSPATAWRDLTGLVKAGLLRAEGKGRGALYRAVADPARVS